MKRILKILKNNEGTSLVEMLFAMAFIGLTIGAFISLAVTSLSFSVIGKTQISLGQHTNLIAEEVVKDYTLDGRLKRIGGSYTNYYCSMKEITALFLDFEGETFCSVTELSAGEGNYEVELRVYLYDREIKSERLLILK